jgi:hypothetical protein
MVSARLLCIFALVAACEPAPPAATPTPEAPPPVAAPTPTSPPGEPSPAPSTATSAPVGSIGGGVILDQPVVLGGIENAAVEAALDPWAAKACNTTGRLGKVLLKFHIDAPGTVSHVELKASTLRHAETEACLQDLVKGTAFPALTRGSTAIVTWPFSI